MKTLYAKHEHGGHQVNLGLVEGKPILEVLWPEGSTQYPSARQLIRALYNQGDTNPTTAKDPGLSLHRYFGVQDEELTQVLKPRPNIRPKHQPKIEVIPFSIFEMFGAGPLIPRAPTALESCPWHQIAVPAPPKLIVAPGITVAPDPGIGIDLQRRGHEVRKLLYAGFSHKLARGGYDPEDVLQEVYRGLLARNNGTCRFDPKKSSFGHYVHLVISCVLSNYHRKDSKKRAVEQVGMFMPSDPEQQVDAALAAETSLDDPTNPELSAQENSTVNSLRELLLDSEGIDDDYNPSSIHVLPLLYQGYTRAEIAQRLNLSPGAVTKAIAYLRKVTAEWRAENP